MRNFTAAEYDKALRSLETMREMVVENEYIHNQSGLLEIIDNEIEHLCVQWRRALNKEKPIVLEG